MEEAPAPTGDKERRDPDTCEDGSCEDTGHGKTRVMVRHGVRRKGGRKGGDERRRRRRTTTSTRVRAAACCAWRAVRGVWCVVCGVCGVWRVGKTDTRWAKRGEAIETPR